MNIRFFTASFISLASSLCALEQTPWFNDLLEFRFTPSYLYRHYPSVANQTSGPKYHSDDNFIDLDLGVRLLPPIEANIGVEFADTTKQALGTQSAFIQARYLLLEDTAGDPVSLTAGLLYRWVSARSLQDVSCPYSGVTNIELSASVGKEFDSVYLWLYRTYLTVALGQANKGSPYLRPYLSFEANRDDAHLFKVFAAGDFGFGHEHQVNVEHFRGYGKILHQSIDIGAGYAYQFLIWGKIGADASYRVFARAYPEKAFSVLVFYQIPFSFF